MASNPIRFLRDHPDFSRYAAGFLPVQFGSQIEAVTIGWQVYEIARRSNSIEESAFLVGMVGLAQFVPMFALTLFAGTLADRVSRKGIVMVALAVMATGAGILSWLAGHEAPNMNAIFAVAALFGAARAFLSPAASALVPMLVPKIHMPQAIALSTTAWMASVIVGPGFGGLLVANSVAAAYAATGLAYLFGMVMIATIRTSSKPAPTNVHPVQMVREGLIYVWTNKIVFGAISLDLVAVLLGGATALLPAFASDILQVGPVGFGALRAAPAVGGFLMVVYLSFFPIRNRAGVTMFWAVAAFGIATIVFGLSRSMPLSLAALVLIGAGDMISVNIRQTLIQIVTPDHMRGRVSAVSSVFISASNELGEFESGVLSKFVGPVMAAVIGGIGTMVVTGAWAWLFPALRKADSLVVHHD
jgi:MFS family permease